VSVTRINEFRAKDGQAQGLRDFLASIVPTIEASDGCRSCRLLQDLDDETMFVVVEVWDSVEAHKASVEGITPEQLEEVTRLLAGPAQGRYLVE
jgi:quinol monooxygenase YgiN